MAEQQEEAWAFVVSTAGDKYVGNIVDQSEGQYPSWVTLKPCLDYINDFQFAQGPQGQIAITGRMRAVTSHDHNVEPSPVHVQVSAVQLISEMGDYDRKNAMTMLASAIQRVELERQKVASGIVLATELPKGAPDAPGRS